MKKATPPSFAKNFFRWYCHPKLLNYIEGDLQELYEERVRESGKRKADLLFLVDVLLLFRPGIIKGDIFLMRVIDTIMITNYITTAYRNLRKNKVFSAINIVGLGIGLTACVLILEFVSFELSYDRLHSKLDRTYRVTNDRFQSGKLIQHGTITYPTIGGTMAKDYPEIEDYTRMMPVGEMNVIVDEKNFRGDICFFADEHFLSVFDFKLLAGDRASLLKDPFTAVLTENTARKFFGVKDQNYADLVGKTFVWGLDPQPYTVKGIVSNVPENSHIQFDVLTSYATLYSGEDKDADISWGWSDMYHYLVLKPGTDYKALERKFDAFSERYFQGDKVSGSIEKFYLQPLADAHLYSDYEYDFAKTANGKAVWAMLVVAGFILLIAWINYVNLTTSRALDRAKEVGLRKVMGAYKTQLVKQFLVESLVITLLAFVVVLILVQVAQPSFNRIIGVNLSLATLFQSLDSSVVLLSIALLLLGALISGFYPAFVLSSYQPVTVLKGKFSHSFKGNFLRKTLVVVQFTASAALIAGTLIVSKQLNFMNKADLGLHIENTIIVEAPALTEWDSTFIGRVESYRHGLSQIEGVKSVSTSTATPGTRLGRNFGIRLSDQPSDAHYTLSFMGIDYNFIDTYEIPVVAGRKFLSSDHHMNYDELKSVLLNESAVKLLGIENAEEAIGKEVIWGNNGTRKWTVVGVIGDFHQESLRKPKEAMIFRPVYSTYNPTSVKIQTAETQRVLAAMEKTYKEFFPGNSFEYSFLDQNFQQQYNDDKRFGTIIRIFTGLAILVSCLGLMGLASYTAMQRTKEIGIRKVLGATVANILLTLSRDLLKPILVSILIATPLAWYAMSGWLEEFVYKISIGWEIFVLSGVLVGLIAFLTIGYQSTKAARANPVKSLRSE